MSTLLSSYPFLIPLLVGLLAEVLKIVSEGIEQGKWRDGLFRPGGMPSSHSAFVMSLLIVVGVKSGLDSGIFAIAFTLACLTWYDAVSSRHAIGEQAKILNRLQKWTRLPERLGHSLLEVIIGAMFGGLMTAVFLLLGPALA